MSVPRELTNPRLPSSGKKYEHTRRFQILKEFSPDYMSYKSYELHTKPQICIRNISKQYTLTFLHIEPDVTVCMHRTDLRVGEDYETQPIKTSM